MVKCYSPQPMDTILRRHTLPQKAYENLSQVFDWATKEDYIRWFTGGDGRHRRTEVMLPRLVRKGKLTSTRYHHKLVYAAPRLTKGKVWNIEHGHGITDGLVRLVISDRNVEIIPERWFKKHGYKIQPEFGLKYTNTILYFEFCTGDNAKRLWNLKSKIKRYEDITGLVLFVLDIDREAVSNLVHTLMAGGQFWFIDYQTFKQAPLGQQLTYPFYINGGRGDILPLKENA